MKLNVIMLKIELFCFVESIESMIPKNLLKQSNKVDLLRYLITLVILITVLHYF